MAETLKGTLYFKGTGKNRQRALKFLTPKNKTWNNEINVNKLADELRMSEEDNIEVELSFESGQPTQVWRAGAARPELTKKATPESAGEQDANRGDAMKREFHNPYNFVPTPLRNTAHPKLGDHEPAGHDHYIAETYSGKLHVTMKAITPLLLLDTARMHIDANEHKSYPVRMDAEGKPLINPTAIKGMLRSAYEAVTNSRMSVFKDHDERLAFRMEANEGLRSIPARIEKDALNGQVYVVLYTGTSTRDSDGTPRKSTVRADKRKYSTMYAAWIRRHKWHGRYATSKLGGKHGDKVWAYITRWEHNRFDFWNVVEISTVAPGPSAPPPSENRKTLWTEKRSDGTERDWRWNNATPSSTPSGQWVEGYICHTNENIQNKHDERLFFNTSFSVEKVLLEERHIGEWKRLVENYYQEHDNGQGGLKDPPEDIKDWSRHIKQFKTTQYQKRDFELQDGTLCYVRGKINATGMFEVDEIYPVMISRRLHEQSPAELLDKLLHPAKLITQLSPADRVFGWVRQILPKEDDLTADEQKLPEEKKAVGAYRGQIRIGTVECKSKDAIQTFGDPDKPNTWLPLQILGQPKPQQGRFYVAKNKDGDAQEKGMSNEQAGYNDSTTKSLRGRKVYPHHDSVPGNYWVDDNALKAELNSAQSDLSQEALQNNGKTYFREYIRPKSGDPCDKQNRSIQGWVKPGTEFEFDIHFTNLSNVELGALLWLLTLNKENEAKYFRFGGGKPLGFGSVRVEFVKDGSDIKSGKELREGRYSSLDDSSLSIGTVDHIDNFRKAVQEAYGKPFEGVAFIAAFGKASTGFGDLPVHYPRKSNAPRPEGESFKWFVANNSKDGFKLTLPNLCDDKGLPLKPEKEK